MLTSHKWSEQTYRLLLKGAPEKIMSFCAFFLEQGEKKPLSDAYKLYLQEFLQTFTSRGLRLIAVGYKDVDDEPEIRSPEKEGGFILLGFIVLRDPLRPDAKEEIRHIKAAGIRPVMITGDHPSTAMAIAIEAG